ncbi:ATP-dependent sacrificial sulfur transferase LarE [Geoalkalibacter halelectricus]|uniref:ATP-dependent sacrificial sulfur transferase LarE n=1 Tax=Geoalkalibacter halelectricus TaxID=2847045 RepID=A0ABY5ZKD1_9BACT|nr:ATP-dependent sacrificial sulfur transferase LarE [Geoalkalibacter halelectricus]MDO3378919.1 ATP-dependent sacrificial sulfur transferase LarE [Geoalkalibacter halelectricus]UWZ79058.1 ATP-dependent sacrificial sulfur transferase LarE [Geoalkalibacter halelectricus]
MSLNEKYTRLKDILADCGSALIAFSGGVDSTFLLRVARDMLGPDKVIALTATSPTYPRHEFELSCRLAREFGVSQIVVESNELDIEGFSQNPPDRCYHCKRELFSLCRDKARDLGFHVIFDGSNSDDLQDYRPGRRAGEELQVRSPLVEAGLSKDDIRALSRDLGLETWDKQPFACLSSRFPYGVEITAERLEQVDRCETYLRENGFRTYRVRFHGEVARIELAPEELPRLLEPTLRQALVAEFKQAGFTYVALDLQGYRSGSMNETMN